MLFRSEMPDGEAFFAEAYRALRPRGRLLIAEPRFHVSKEAFEQSVGAAERAGFVREQGSPFTGAHGAVLRRS